MITQGEWDETFRKTEELDHRRICQLDAEELCQALQEDWEVETIRFCCVRVSFREIVRAHLFVGESDPHQFADEDMWDCWAPCEQHLQLLAQKFDFGLQLAYYQLTEA